MSRRIRLPIALFALALCAFMGAVGSSAGARPTARAAAGCSSASPGSLRGGYYLNLTVHGANCGTGRGVEAGWQSCRLSHGLAGRCHSAVHGFSCHETRQRISTQITAKVSCHRGGARVSYIYQQNLA